MVCRIPGDEDGVTLEEGLAWLDRSVDEGLAVDDRIVPDPAGEGGEIWLMPWDPSEPKPPWSEDWEKDGQRLSAGGVRGLAGRRELEVLVPRS